MNPIYNTGNPTQISFINRPHASRPLERIHRTRLLDECVKTHMVSTACVVTNANDGVKGRSFFFGRRRHGPSFDVFKRFARRRSSRNENARRILTAMFTGCRYGVKAHLKNVHRQLSVVFPSTQVFPPYFVCRSLFGLCRSLSSLYIFGKLALFVLSTCCFRK